MTSDDFQAQCIEMINRLLAYGFEHPIYFSAIAIDGLTMNGSSETITNPIQLMVAASNPLPIILPPINCLCVDPKGKVAHGVVYGLGAVSYSVLT